MVKITTALLGGMLIAFASTGAKAELVRVQSACGIPIVVSTSFEPKIQRFIVALKSRGYCPRHIGCFATGGHVRGSLHYSGNACDFDQHGWGLTVRTMYHLGGLAESYGLRNGCDFGDCGHIDSGQRLARGYEPRNPFYPKNYFRKAYARWFGHHGHAHHRWASSAWRHSFRHRYAYR